MTAGPMVTLSLPAIFWRGLPWAIAFWVYCLAWLSVSWNWIGIYSEKIEGTVRRFQVIKIIELRALVVPPQWGLQGGFGATHTRFYSATCIHRGDRIPAVVVRYFPDALGRPFFGSRNGMKIKWATTPRLRGLMFRGRFTVMVVAEPPPTRPDARGPRVGERDDDSDAGVRADANLNRGSAPTSLG
jgi:hypothetical protein